MSPIFIINLHNGVPAYRQIMDQIKLKIVTGQLPAGTEMPSTRGLSAELKLNPMTVSKAYGLLERDGVLERRRGQTLVVRERTAAAGEKPRLEPLREQLVAATALARQLGISRSEALRLFRETFDSSSP